jgi:hypothetical protein
MCARASAHYPGFGHFSETRGVAVPIVVLLFKEWNDIFFPQDSGSSHNDGLSASLRCAFEAAEEGPEDDTDTEEVDGMDPPRGV